MFAVVLQRRGRGLYPHETVMDHDIHEKPNALHKKTRPLGAAGEHEQTPSGERQPEQRIAPNLPGRPATADMGTRGRACSSSSLMKRLTNLVEVVALLSICATALGFLGRWHFLPDLFSHFRVQLTATLLVSAVLLYLLQRPRWSIVSGAVGTVLLASLWPFLCPSASVPSRYRLVSINVLSSNPRKADVIRFIIESDPDFVVLLEPNQRWITKLDQALAAKWPHRKATARSDNFGVAIYSKLPWVACDVVEYSSELATPSISALFDLSHSQQLRLIATHPAPPMNASWWRSRNSLFTHMAEDVRTGVGDTTIVAGDLNCTPWSHWFKRLTHDSGLRPSAYGNGLNISWRPISLPLCGLPIDHVLVGKGIEVGKSEIGPEVGSDHRPLVVDFGLIDSEAAQDAGTL